jgi:hypothetical protein
MIGTCLWCGGKLYFIPSRGWIHASTGTAYITRKDPDGVERDDHCALPVAP